jgi:hypothetical protein
MYYQVQCPYSTISTASRSLAFHARSPLRAMKVATLARMGLVHVAAVEYVWSTKYGRVEDVPRFNLRQIGLRLLGVL